MSNVQTAVQEFNVQNAMQEIEERFVAWATSCHDIRAACVIGSRARADHPADAWSNLDIVIITSEPERYHHSFRGRPQ